MDDCSVLRKAVFTFRQEFMHLFDFDIFEKACTLASGVMMGYRLKYLQPDTIQNIPEYGEGLARRMQSVKALKFLAWISHQTGKNIRTAGSFLGERRVKCGDSAFWTDGVVEDPETGQPKEIIEVLGCLYHACPDCFPDRDKLWIDGVSTYQDVLNRTLWRLQKMRDAFPTCKVRYYWEHQYDGAYKQYIEMRQFVDTHEIPPPLQPRDGFFGGR